MLALDPANASDGTASIHRRRDDTRTFPYVADRQAGIKLATPEDPPSDIRGYQRRVASRRPYVAAFNKACNPQTTEDADTWLVYGGL
ncbi:hypothetical protein ALC53_00589 [Atta colombica]|uniref:Uncharacterized protein n=1 Tax=Atta colombica TaxID=520822 RepID=A0A195BXM9_9HYME|nr:hypothetical protein ALC53_00589 [Atta colombica]